jgi:protein-tyrosine sulfotransferase
MAWCDLISRRRRWQVRGWYEAGKISDLAPVVIGGCGTSGTTLLRATLNAHPDIASGPESTVFLQRVSSPATIGPRFGLPAKAIEQLLQQSRTQVEFIEQFAALCLQQRGKTIWADKTPENVTRLEYIFRHFPRAKFVHVTRDGRDVACSLRTQHWMKLSACERDSLPGLLRCADYWIDRVQRALRYRNDPRYFAIRYEDIVQQPETAMRRLLKFLDRPWSDKLLDRTYVNTNMLREEEVPPSSASGPLLRDAIGRWRSELNSEAVALITPRITPMLKILGYLDARSVERPSGSPAKAAAGFGE